MHRARRAPADRRGTRPTRRVERSGAFHHGQRNRSAHAFGAGPPHACRVARVPDRRDRRGEGGVQYTRRVHRGTAKRGLQRWRVFRESAGTSHVRVAAAGSTRHAVSARSAGSARPRGSPSWAPRPRCWPCSSSASPPPTGLRAASAHPDRSGRSTTDTVTRRFAPASSRRRSRGCGGSPRRNCEPHQDRRRRPRRTRRGRREAWGAAGPPPVPSTGRLQTLPKAAPSAPGPHGSPWTTSRSDAPA